MENRKLTENIFSHIKNDNFEVDRASNVSEGTLQKNGINNDSKKISWTSSLLVNVGETR